MKRLTAVKATATQFQPRPEWAHPTSETHQAAYVRAVSFLRRGRQSRWLLDRESIRPKWSAIPKEEATA